MRAAHRCGAMRRMAVDWLVQRHAGPSPRTGGTTRGQGFDRHVTAAEQHRTVRPWARSGSHERFVSQSARLRRLRDVSKNGRGLLRQDPVPGPVFGMCGSLFVRLSSCGSCPCRLSRTAGRLSTPAIPHCCDGVPSQVPLSAGWATPSAVRRRQLGQLLLSLGLAFALSVG